MEVIRSGTPKLNIEEPQDQADGKTSWLQTCKIPLRDETGKVVGVMGTYTDITERKIYQHLIEHQASYDELTGLPNRRQLQRLIHDHISANSVGYAGILFIDLDYFKTINDSLGHSIGDNILKQVAQRISKVVGSKGTVARLGGDEFSVFAEIDKHDQPDQQAHMKTIAEVVIDSLTQPFLVDCHKLYLGASVGISIIPPGISQTTDIFREADMAMYMAKEMGRNTLAFYDASMHQQAEKTHELKNHLHQALANNEFQLAYQPQFDAEGSIMGCEGLLRWINAELGFVSPVDFIPLAEQTGLIHQIGLWVIAEAIAVLEKLSKDINDDFKLAINISTIQFQNEHFVSEVAKLIASKPIAKKHLQLEITESLLLNNEKEALEKLHEFRLLGLTIAIDDFGTGYSSLAYLTRLPIDKLKIDRSFVSSLSNDERNATIVSTIIQMARSLQMEVIAEGVETEVERQFLVDHGCYQFQGYLFSKPVSEESLIEMLIEG